MREAINNYCARIGKDPLLVQGPGGNVSWKDGKTLWIKASGTCLADAKKDDIFVPVVLDELRSALAETPFPQLPGRMAGNAPRPSIETFMHVALPQKVVVHLHAIEALAVLVRSDAHEALRTRLGSRFSWTWVPYRQPGAALAQAVALALHRTPDANIVFLQNHGILAGGEDIEHIDRCLADIISVLKQDLAVSNDFETHPAPPPPPPPPLKQHIAYRATGLCRNRRCAPPEHGAHPGTLPKTIGSLGALSRPYRLSWRESPRVRNPGRCREIWWKASSPLALHTRRRRFCKAGI